MSKPNRSSIFTLTCRRKLIGVIPKSFRFNSAVHRSLPFPPILAHKGLRDDPIRKLCQRTREKKLAPGMGIDAFIEQNDPS